MNAKNKIIKNNAVIAGLTRNPHQTKGFRIKCGMTKKWILSVCLLFTLWGLGGLGFTVNAQTIDTLIFTWEKEAGIEYEFSIYASPNQAFTVDWGDGSSETQMSDNSSAYFVWHEYVVSGTYTVTVIGSPTCNFMRLIFFNANVNYIMSKCKNCIQLTSKGIEIDRSYIGSKIYAIDITNTDNPNYLSISLQNNRMPLTQCYKAYEAIKRGSPFTLAQYLVPRTVARGDTIDFSSETTFYNPSLYNNPQPTLFEVFKKDSLYTCPKYGSIAEYHGFCIPAVQGDYTETNGILAFYKPGDYIIKMSNPAVLTDDGTHIIPTEVYQQIILPPNNDACLANISVSKGVLNPVFECDTLNYTVEVAYSVSSVVITAVPSDTMATVTGDVGLQQLQVGGNIFTITVTAEDDSTTKTYTVVITRRIAASDACLTTLTVSEGVLTPAFNCDTLNYTVDVGYKVSSAIITALASDPFARVEINGIVKTQFIASLQVGTNSFPITVTAEDGITAKTYTVRINRAAASDVCLTNLAVSEGVLTPVFECETLNYTVDVPYRVSFVVITATASDPEASVSGTGNKQLQVGANTFLVTVIAKDSITTKTYTVVINRENGGTEACLFTLKVESEVSENVLREEVLQPTVECKNLVYTANVGYDISSVVITAAPSDSNASVTGTGKKQLQVGLNTFPITVVSETGHFQRTYKVLIYRAEKGGTGTKKPLLIYPNPTDGLLYIVNYESRMGNIEICDASGKLLNAEQRTGEGKIVIDISHWANGVYFLKVNGEVIKFVKE
jgi:hypothetical protein